MRNAKFEVRNSKCEMRNAKCEIQNAKREMRRAKFKMRNAKCKIRNGSTIATANANMNATPSCTRLPPSLYLLPRPLQPLSLFAARIATPASFAVVPDHCLRRAYKSVRKPGTQLRRVERCNGPAIKIQCSYQGQI